MKMFISHSSCDKDFVDKLVDEMSSWHFDVWYDKWEIRPGESIVKKVQAGLEECDCLIIVLSKEACAANWVQIEVNSYLNDAIAEKKGTLIPVVIEECKPNIFIRGLRQIRFYELDYDTALLQLVSRLSELIPFNDNNRALDAFKRVNAPEETKIKFLQRYSARIKDPRSINSDYIILKDVSNLKILPDGTFHYERILDIQLGAHKWDANVFCDRVFNSEETPSLITNNYSTNSTINEGNIRSDLNYLYINWVPSKHIKPGAIYRHKYTTQFNKELKDPTNAWVHRRYPFPTIWTEFTLTSLMPLENITVCRAPFTFDLKHGWEFNAYSLLSHDHFEGIVKKGKSLKICLNSREVGDGLIIGLFTEGWKQSLEAEKSATGRAYVQQFERNWKIENELRNHIGWGALI